MTAGHMRTLGLVLLLAGIVAIAVARFSALLPHEALWAGLLAIVLAWVLIGLSFRSLKAPES